jgi:hypothetical protein
MMFDDDRIWYMVLGAGITMILVIALSIAHSVGKSEGLIHCQNSAAVVGKGSEQ